MSRQKKYKMKAIPSAISEKGGFTAQFIGDGYSVDARKEILPNTIKENGVQVGEGVAWNLIQSFLKNCAAHAAATGEIAKELSAQGVESSIFWIGTEPLAGCIGCGACRKEGADGCFRKDRVNDFTAIAAEADGFVFGTPVHWASASGAITSFMDRVFFSAGGRLRGKPAACIASARRAGTTAALDQLNKYFYICGLPIAPSQYWAMVHGSKPEDVAKDLEGLQIMRSLARNIAWMAKCFAAGKASGIDMPAPEPAVRTNFFR